AIAPCTLRQANAFVAAHHRHHRPARGCRFTLGVADGEGRLRGVAVVGRPVSRMLDDGRTAEVTRLWSDGARNACSLLLGACWRAARALGYRKLITYTMPEEGGASLRGAGWKLVGETEGRSWSRPGRGRTDKHPVGVKLRWEVSA